VVSVNSWLLAVSGVNYILSPPRQPHFGFSSRTCVSERTQPPAIWRVASERMDGDQRLHATGQFLFNQGAQDG
jgi:hypothetical protein